MVGIVIGTVRTTRCSNANHVLAGRYRGLSGGRVQRDDGVRTGQSEISGHFQRLHERRRRACGRTSPYTQTPVNEMLTITPPSATPVVVAAVPIAMIATPGHLSCLHHSACGPEPVACRERAHAEHAVCADTAHPYHGRHAYAHSERRRRPVSRDPRDACHRRTGPRIRIRLGGPEHAHECRT